jgi:hypothetical protein
LAFLAAVLEPPPDFVYFDFGIAPPPPTEVVFVERPVIIFEGPGFAPPPPPPVFFLPPRPREYVVLAPPPPQRERFALPIAAAPIPTFVRPPRTVTLQQQPPQTTNAPGGRATVNVSLPSVVSHGNQGNQGAPTSPGTPPGQNTPSTTLAPATPSTRTALPHPGGGLARPARLADLRPPQRLQAHQSKLHRSSRILVERADRAPAPARRSRRRQTQPSRRRHLLRHRTPAARAMDRAAFRPTHRQMQR